MSSRTPDSRQLHHIFRMPDFRITQSLDIQFLGVKTRLPVLALTLLVGSIMGLLAIVFPPLYLFFVIGGLVFAYLLLFKIEVAIILALLIQNQLGEYNYLGGGTPYHPNGIMGIAIIFGTLCFILFSKIDYSRLRPIRAFFFFLIICLLTLIFAREYLFQGITVTLRLAVAFCIYAVLLYKLDSIKQVKWVIIAVVAAQILPTVSGLMVMAGTSGLSFVKGETARLGHSGIGVYLAMVLTLCLVLFLNVKTSGEKFLWGVLTALFGLGLFFSFGRSGWISFIVALTIIGVVRHRKILLFLPVLVMLAIILIPAIPQRFSDIDITNLDQGNASTLSGRIQVWKTGLKLYVTQPLLGVGYGLGRYRIGEYLHRYAWMIHNDYISILLETGLIGLIIFAFWHGQWLVRLFKTYYSAYGTNEKMLILAVSAVFASSLVARLTDNIIQDSYKLYPLCALVAAALAIPRIMANTLNKQPEVTPLESETNERYPEV